MILTPGKLYVTKDNMVGLPQEIVFKKTGESINVPVNTNLIFIEDRDCHYDDIENGSRCLSFLSKNYVINFIYQDDYTSITDMLQEV